MPDSESNYDVEFNSILVVPNKDNIDWQFVIDCDQFHTAFTETTERN